jgi:amidase
MSDKIARRDFLGSVALVGAAAAAGQNFMAQPASAAAETASPIISSSATELADAIRSKKLTSKEIVEAHLERIAAVNPKLNAIVQLTADTARKEAEDADAALARGEIKGPLHGVPMTIKDTLETSGVICTGGTKGRANYVPKADASAVARLRAAGAIFLGKTNVPELAGAVESDNLVYGRTNNPYDLARTPGGSSGGEAAIIAACGSPMGLGTDAGGSIRIPAHFCGLAAIKPTRPGAAHRTVSAADGCACAGVSCQPDRAAGRGSRARAAHHLRSRFPRRLDRWHAAARSESRDAERPEAGVLR